MNSRRPTINDVASLAGVSIKTVSRVFNREPNVRESTHDKVIAAAESLKYRPNLSARQLAGKLTYVVGMLYDNPISDYVLVVQNGAIQACREHGYNLLINPCQADSPDLIDEVIGLHRQVDGFIVLQPLSDLDKLNRLLLQSDTPCVRVSQKPLEGCPRISVGDTDAADQMTEHLIDLGHRRIGFIVGHPDHGQSEDRLVGYRRALDRHGIEFDEALVEQGQFDYDSGYSCARNLLMSDPAPTAIFASNDPMAMGVLSAAHEMGVKIPGELSVAGFDDSPLAQHAWPRLTTVRQPIAEVARLATEVLMKLLRGQAESDFHHCLQAELVCRASTAAAPSREGSREATVRKRECR